MINEELNPNRRWLIDHAGEYEYRWVALRGGVLLESKDTLIEIRDALELRGERLPSREIMITTGF